MRRRTDQGQAGGGVCYGLSRGVTLIATPDDPVLVRLRDALAKHYGPRLERAVLFGSRARGDSRPDSDYDVAVFLRGLGGLWDELGPLSEITADILLDTGAVVSAKPFRSEARGSGGSLMGEIARDGRDL